MQILVETHGKLITVMLKVILGNPFYTGKYLGTVNDQAKGQTNYVWNRSIIL